jgi:hypothetical protein
MATIARGVAVRARGASGTSRATRARVERRVATRARAVGRDDEGEGDEEAPIRFWLHRVHATDVTLGDVARSHGTSEEYLLVRVRVRATDVRAREVCVEYRVLTGHFFGDAAVQCGGGGARACARWCARDERRDFNTVSL